MLSGVFGRGGGLSIWAGRQGKGGGGAIIVYVYPCHQVYGGATLGSNHQRSSELKKSYWSRTTFWTQGVYTRDTGPRYENLKCH